MSTLTAPMSALSRLRPDATLRAGRHVTLVAGVLLMAACGSSDPDGPSSVPVAGGTSATADDTTDVPTDDETAVGGEAGTESTPDLEDVATSCLVGTWVVDGPRYVANAMAAHGEPISYVSGTTSITFFEDGTYTGAHDAFRILIEGEDGPAYAEEHGTEQGTWEVSPLSGAEVDVLVDVERPEAHDLPQIALEPTDLSVTQTLERDGVTVPLGELPLDEGTAGIGPVDCTDGTLTIRLYRLPVDVPLVRDASR